MRLKYKYLLLLAVFSHATALNAQTDRGWYLAGGTADVSDNFNGMNRNFNLSAAPSFAIFVVNGFAVGGKYAFTLGNSRTYDMGGGVTSITSVQTLVGPYLKGYFGKKQLRGVASCSGGYSVFTAFSSGDVVSVNGFELQGTLGMAYFFNPHISLETAGYVTLAGYQTVYPSTQFGLSVGFFIFLDKKKQE